MPSERPLRNPNMDAISRGKGVFQTTLTRYSQHLGSQGNARIEDLCFSERRGGFHLVISSWLFWNRSHNIVTRSPGSPLTFVNSESISVSWKKHGSIHDSRELDHASTPSAPVKERLQTGFLGENNGAMDAWKCGVSLDY